jgi:hypothetical protein
MDVIKEVKMDLSSKFYMKYINDANFILGWTLKENGKLENFC